MTARVLTKSGAQKAFVLMGMLPLALGAGAELCRAQSAAVTFQVEMPDKEMKKGLRVRAIQKPPGTRSKTQELTVKDYNYSMKLYVHKMDRLPAGEYYFVLCDDRHYRPLIQTGTLQPGGTLPVSFLSEDQATGKAHIDDVLGGSEGRHADAGTTVFLKDLITGCTVDHTTTNQDGKYEFTALPEKVKYGVSTDEADSDPSNATTHD